MRRSRTKHAQAGSPCKSSHYDIWLDECQTTTGRRQSAHNHTCLPATWKECNQTESLDLAVCMKYGEKVAPFLPAEEVFGRGDHAS